MQNRNQSIEERLQIINDYIQRTMDALNATRQVVQGLSSNYQQGFVPQNTTGISHSSFVGTPQFVQTPYGLVAVDPRFTQVPQVQNQLPVGYGYGLNHSNFVPQFQTWPMNVSPYGIPQVVPQVGYNMNPLGWNPGLNHTPFVPTTWPVQLHQQWPVQNVQQWPVQTQWGVNQVVPQTNVVPNQTL